LKTRENEILIPSTNDTFSFESNNTWHFRILYEFGLFLYFFQYELDKIEYKKKEKKRSVFYSRKKKQPGEENKICQ